MKIELDRGAKAPFYKQIADQLRRQIVLGELPEGFKLPAERKLAERLGVNRTTVLNAYEVLKAEGLLEAYVGNGTVVSGKRGDGSPASAKQENRSLASPLWSQLFSKRAGQSDDGLVGELLSLASRTDVISFATGIASPDSGPTEIIDGLEGEIFKQENRRALLHSPTEGFLSLRRELCGLMQKRGIFCTAREVMLLAGSQQGLDLAARVLLDPGDIVVVEEPTYFPAIGVFKAAGARVMPVPVDEGGMSIDALEQLLSRFRPKLIYTIPTYQNPTGTEMTLERRQRLLGLAVRYNVLILEDDAYGDLSYEGYQEPLLKAMDTSGHVLYLSTFSKNVYSGLRLGWLVADPEVIARFSKAKQLADLHSGSLSQWLVERFIASGAMDRHLARICTEYRERRDLMIAALTAHAPAGTVWNTPRGGYYVWCRLPKGVSASVLVARAAEQKVTFIPGAPFFVSENGDSYLRLNFTFAPKESIPEGIRRLCAAMTTLLEENSHAGRSEQLSDVAPII